MSRRGANKGVVINAASSLTLLTVIGLAGCSAQDSRHVPRTMTQQDLNAYNAWVMQQKKKTSDDAFDANPLRVNAMGKVKAIPDIAVITARISAKNLNESKALNEVSETINAVQLALKDSDVETGFTAISSAVETDQACLNENALARQRHNLIVSDYWFNKNLDDRGDKETKRREMKPRLSEAICKVETVEVATNMVIRVRPASDAGAVLKALGDADVSSGQLFGYDFSDYDSLYQEAAAKAVSAARKKAEMITRVAQTELGEITNFRIDRPSRTGRFGPQPNIVNRNRNIGGGYSQTVVQQTGEILARVMIPARFRTITEPIVVQEASTELVTIPATYETVMETVVVQPQYADGSGNFIPAVTKQVARRVIKTPASTQERIIPAVTKMETRRVLVEPARPSSNQLGATSQSNALQMSLLSGPQTVSVTAYLSYDYKTPIDGTIVPDEEG